MAAARRAFAGLKPEKVSGWRVFDAKDQVLGRLASRLSVVLQGKDKPIYSPSIDKGDVCIVVNADKIAVTGLKERTLKDQMAKDPKEVIRKAVLRMLPRNRLVDVSGLNDGRWQLEQWRKLMLLLDVCTHSQSSAAHAAPQQARGCESHD
ncbi:unnamed protein product [Closterium sp. NIES-54]